MLPKERIMRLRAEGMSFGDIAKIFQVSRQRIWQVVTKYKSLPENIRKEILERDEFTCQKCKSKKNIQVHHLDGNCGNNIKTNLITVCRNCHAILDQNNKWLSNYQDKNIY